MLLLASTSDLVRVTTSAATAVDVHASWVDLTTSSGAVTPGRTNTAISTATTTTVTGSPGSGVVRTLKLLTVRNTSTTTANDITVLHTDGTTAVTCTKVTLGAGEMLQFSDNGWVVQDSKGNVKTAQGIAAAGVDKSMQYNDGGTTVGSESTFTYDKTNDQLAITGGAPSSLVLSGHNSANPTSPASGQTAIFARSIANRMLPAFVGPSGLDSSLQPILARNKVGLWVPPGNATTVPGVLGLTALTAQGTATSRTVATTSLATRMRRLGYPSTATAGTFAGARLNVAQFSCGSGTADGSGFFMVMRWVESDPATVSGRRAFHGMTATTGAFTNVEVNTLLNQVGICQLSTDATQWYWIASGTSAQSATAIGTGIGAPGGNSTTAWELAIFAPQGVANTYYLQLTNLTTGVVATTTFTGASTVIPQSGTLLAWNSWATNNATALAVGIDLASLYIETDT